MNTPTKKGTPRQPATVNRELTLLSSAYSLAVKYDKAESNPCSKVDLFTLDNLRYRYLLPEEEPRLMAHLSGPRATMMSEKLWLNCAGRKQQMIMSLAVPKPNHACGKRNEVFAQLANWLVLKD